MFYALVCYPSIDTTYINQLRSKYDPQFNLIAPHITLIFPVPESIVIEHLIRHIKIVLSEWRPFPIGLQGLHKSSDSYLFLILQTGNAEVISLYEKLYTGILAKYRREDIPFIPHVTLGVFHKNIDKYAEAMVEAKQLEFDYDCVLDELCLLAFDNDKSQIIWEKNSRLVNQIP